MTLLMVLNRLTMLPGFKMYRENGSIIINADNCCWDISSMPLEEGLVEAYVGIEAERRARELVKQAKVVL